MEEGRSAACSLSPGFVAKVLRRGSARNPGAPVWPNPTPFTNYYRRLGKAAAWLEWSGWLIDGSGLIVSPARLSRPCLQHVKDVVRLITAEFAAGAAEHIGETQTRSRMEGMMSRQINQRVQTNTRGGVSY